MEADPAPLVLQLAEWGAGLGETLPWLEAPPPAHLREGQELMRQLGALEEGGQLNAHGRRLASLGVHPRLAQLLLRSCELGAADLGCGMAALLSERDPLSQLEAGCDLMRRIDWLRSPGREPRRQQLRQLQQQLQRQLPKQPQGTAPAGNEAAIAAELLAHAYPERVALERTPGSGRYLTRGGRGAVLHPSDPLVGSPALAIAAADGGSSDARIQLALPLPPSSLTTLALAAGEELAQVSWDSQQERIRAERELRLGALVLERRPWPDAPADVLRTALLTGLNELGIEALPWDGSSRQLQQRLSLAHRELGAPWPNRSDTALAADPESWLGDQLDGLRSRADLQGLNLEEALWQGLPWEARRELETLLPEALPIPSGRLARLDYGSGEPVLAVKLQELFGAASTPTVLGGRLAVTVQLLSPAGRPAAITQDLAGFWSGAYQEVRKELRGRYPRHPWPEDPANTPATALTNRALQRRQSQR
jgi:ATP-dependent helicase HrpB